jgi:hypothetical protein
MLCQVPLLVHVLKIKERSIVTIAIVIALSKNGTQCRTRHRSWQ